MLLLHRRSMIGSPSMVIEHLECSLQFAVESPIEA